jgi:3-oxoacyl-[acyl-carrier-protein] synthase-3
MIQVGIRSVGICLPKKVLTNADLEKMVDTSDEWIVTRTGIRERHILDKGEKITDLVYKAAKSACDKANLSSDKVDFVISSTIASDRVSPAMAFEVARDLQSNQVFCFDINAACSGLIYGLATAESILKTRPVKNGIVTAGEHLTRFIDYTDRSSCILFGDAASALVLTNDHPEHLLLYTELGADPTQSNEVTIGGFDDLLEERKQDYYFRQNGKTVFKFAVNKIKEMYETIPQKVGIKPEQIRYVISHQANLRIIEAAGKEITAGGNTEFLNNLDRYGNTSSPSIGLVLEENWSRFEKGDYIMLVAFGAGLGWGAALLQW